VAEALTRNTADLPVRVMFQDEARFGRLSDPRRCWAPLPVRPLVCQGVVREYSYAYAAVSPADGQLDWMWSYAMNTTEMGAFLEHVSRSHADEFVVMVLDGAPSHRCGYLRIPHNVGLVRLPPYSPELNPAERLWDEIREKYYANRVFDSLGGAIAQGVRALQELARSPAALSSLTNWPWIRNRIGSS
jgi:transposase-like protein